MLIEICSFGNKYGQPSADLILDVRCLENPFWVPELREKTGLDGEVVAYIQSHNGAYLQQLRRLICLHGDLAAERSCSCLRIAVGCTGGRHRSVCVAEYLADALKEKFEVTLCHRDIDRG